MAAISQAQVATLLQSLLSRGLEAKDALPTVKALMEAKIFSLDDVTADSPLPMSISAKLQNKLRPNKRRRAAAASNSNNNNDDDDDNNDSALTIMNKRTRKANKKVNLIEFPPPIEDRPTQILINRSPVLTLWAAIVAMMRFHKANDNNYEALTFEEALSFGAALASITARGKGEDLGIFTPSEKRDKAQRSDPTFDLMGTTLRFVSTSAGIRALGADSKEQDPAKTWKLLKQRFGNAFGHVAQEMMEAAKMAGDHLEATAYAFYVNIRPSVPNGTKGWGARGRLEIGKIQSYYHHGAK